MSGLGRTVHHRPGEAHEELVNMSDFWWSTRQVVTYIQGVAERGGQCSTSES